MRLINREPSPAQSIASRANSRRSTGPRSEQGKANSSQNLPKPRPFSQVVARSMEALSESPGDFEQMRQALSAAMEPRDAWEAAWVQDIAILRWRLERLGRAEAGLLALRRRRLQNQRQRSTAAPTGKEALELNGLAGLWGFTGIPDSPLKFEQVIKLLTFLRMVVRTEEFGGDTDVYFSLLYGKAPGPRAAMLKTRFESVAKGFNKEPPEDSLEERKSLVAELDKEIEHWEQMAALYTAEHLQSDPLQDDAELLLPSQELDEIIRYETHLETQIERKLRQFYARRREPALRETDSLAEIVAARETAEEAETGEDLACQSAALES